MKSKLRIALEVLILVAIVAYIVSRIDLAKIGEILSTLSYSWLILALLLNTTGILVTAYGLKILFDTVRFTSFMQWLKYFLMSFSVGLILPGKAGDLSIIYFMKDKGFSIGESTAFTILDKLITIVVFGLVATVGIFTILSSAELYIGLLFLAVIAATGAFLFSEPGRRVASKVLGKYAEKFQGFGSTFRTLVKKHRSRVLINVFLTAVRPFINGLVIILLFKAMSIDVSLFYAILINAIALAASLIPLTPNGLGVREGVGAYLFSLVGVPLEASISMYLIFLIMWQIFGLIGVGCYLTRKRKTKLGI